jgi:NADP-dependent 3-hydroxy acid dehydrogenase YdfG
MAGRVENKVALITGGGSGIGRATALLFGREGAKVLVADYNAEGGEATVKTIKEAGGTAIFHVADVSNPQDVDGLMHKVVETYGRLDYAFNNAGIEGHAAVTPDCTLENWNRVIAINLTGVFLCMKYETPLMLKHGGGCIVNTASAAGLVGGKGMPAYFAAKHGVAGLNEGCCTRIRAEGDSCQRGLSRSYSDADGRANPGYGRPQRGADFCRRADASDGQARGDRPGGAVALLRCLVICDRAADARRWRLRRPVRTASVGIRPQRSRLERRKHGCVKKNKS